MNLPEIKAVLLKNGFRVMENPGHLNIMYPGSCGMVSLVAESPEGPYMTLLNQHEIIMRTLGPRPPDSPTAYHAETPKACPGCVICVNGGMMLIDNKGHWHGAGVIPYDD